MADYVTVLRRALPNPVVRQLKRTLPGAVRRRLTPQRTWAVGLARGTSPLALTPSFRIGNPILTAADVTDVDAGFVADPFAVQRDREWHLFAEVMDRATGRGVIARASSSDLRTWTYRGVVLREAFHLSYPHVVEHRGAVYLIPEAAESGSVLLYRAAPFPDVWEQVGPLLGGQTDGLLDPTVFRRNGRWWLLAAGGAADDVLRLYSSAELVTGWAEHPESPIVTGDPRGARPAGRVVDVGGRLYRFAQDCYPAYGSRVIAFEIDTLTATEYEDRRVETPVLRGSGSGWNAAAMHHVDAHQLPDGSWLAFVDGSR